MLFFPTELRSAITAEHMLQSYCRSHIHVSTFWGAESTPANKEQIMDKCKTCLNQLMVTKPSRSSAIKTHSQVKTSTQSARVLLRRFIFISLQSYSAFTCQEVSPLTFNNGILAENNEPRADH